MEICNGVGGRFRSATENYHVYCNIVCQCRSGIAIVVGSEIMLVHCCDKINTVSCIKYTGFLRAILIHPFSFYILYKKTVFSGYHTAIFISIMASAYVSNIANVKCKRLNKHNKQTHSTIQTRNNYFRITQIIILCCTTLQMIFYKMCGMFFRYLTFP